MADEPMNEIEKNEDFSIGNGDDRVEKKKEARTEGTRREGSRSGGDRRQSGGGYQGGSASA